MVRRLALFVVFAIAEGILLGAATPLLAQDAPVACGSASRLEPAATPEGTAGPAVREITEPAPAWMKTELVDACSGKRFALADLAGKTIYIEAMATWCPPCRDQLARVKEALAQLTSEERADVVVVALSSEVGLPRETLAAYATDNDFPFVFAVMSEEMLQAMVDDLGKVIALPPVTPHLIVAPDGTIGAVQTGNTSPEELVTLLTQDRGGDAS